MFVSCIFSLDKIIQIEILYPIVMYLIKVVHLSPYLSHSPGLLFMKTSLLPQLSRSHITRVFLSPSLVQSTSLSHSLSSPPPTVTYPLFLLTLSHSLSLLPLCSTTFSHSPSLSLSLNHTQILSLSSGPVFTSTWLDLTLFAPLTRVSLLYHTHTPPPHVQYTTLSHSSSHSLPLTHTQKLSHSPGSLFPSTCLYLTLSTLYP